MCIRDRLQLARHPEKQARLRDELLRIKDPRERRHSAALKNVIRESLRLNPVAPIVALRVLAADVPFGKDGGYIPAKSTVAVPAYALHRNAAVFDEPDEYKPERWEEPTKEMNEAWMSFGVGRRGCQGQALANAELSVFLAKLCSEFEWTVEKEGKEEFYVTPVSYTHLTLPTIYSV